MDNVYRVIDSRTGKIVGVYNSLAAAYRRADKLDAEYGAVRYIVTRPTWGASVLSAGPL
jgi:hypothetical protein